MGPKNGFLDSDPGDMVHTTPILIQLKIQDKTPDPLKTVWGTGRVPTPWRQNKCKSKQKKCKRVVW